ncbi:NAD-dependent protein deacetylase [Castellaniella defragrans]
MPEETLKQSEETLKQFFEQHSRVFVLTGAGCSTESGIPDYRDESGAWKNAQPIQFRDFMADPLRRARYWARSLIGWRHFGAARPNAAHASLAELERQGHIELLVTQNVDGLHQAAGSRLVVDLHGRLDAVRCMQCGDVTRRASLQPLLESLNPDWRHREAVTAPDGDALLVDVDFAGFKVPACPLCGGILKPDVVFFGESVPAERVQAAYAGLERADAMLVVGSSLMVYSGYRYARAAAERGLPIAAVNRGRTRADALLSFKVPRPCGETLTGLASALAPHVP